MAKGMVPGLPVLCPPGLDSLQAAVKVRVEGTRVAVTMGQGM